MTTRSDVLLDRYIALAAAIVWRAVLDAQHADARGARARRWLESDPWAFEILAVTKRDPEVFVYGGLQTAAAMAAINGLNLRR